MSSLHPSYLKALKFTNQDLSTLNKLGEYRGKQAIYLDRSPETLESLRKVAVVESTESSNRLEGIKTSRKRLKGIVLEDTTPEDRDEQEIAGYRDALALVHEHYNELEVSTDTIKLLHSTIHKYLPIEAGEWKIKSNYIIEDMPDGTVRIRFEPTSPEETPAAMEELVRLYHTAPPNVDPLVIVPGAILDMLCIHPFTDGNGRVARLLTLLMLYQHGILVGRYVSLERVFEVSKTSYYETLERSSIGWHKGKHDVMHWTRYFWGVLLSAYSELDERIGKVRTKKGAKQEMVFNTIKRSAVPISVGEIMEACPGVSRQTVKLVLNDLRDKGMVESTGIGRSAKWKKVPSSKWDKE